LNKTLTDQSGLTLIELVAVIVILSVALVGISAAISGAISRSADVLLEVRAVALAQSYLDEILGKRFDEESAPRGIPPCGPAAQGLIDCTVFALFGPEDGEAGRAEDDDNGRADYDDVDDYHNLDEGRGQSTFLQDAEGNERVGYENFRVQVSVRYLALASGGTEENLATEADDLTASEDAKLITVTVSHASRSSDWSFSVYKANF
jgi:MSHA pilin protein MshD